MKLIEQELYQTILESVVNFCVDVVVKHKDRYILVTRTDNPMKGEPWVIGGRVQQGESVRSAAIRKLKEEIGVTSYLKLKPVGYYEDVYDSTAFKENVIYHSFSFVYETEIESIEDIKLDKTSNGWGLYDNLPSRFNLRNFDE